MHDVRFALAGAIVLAFGLAAIVVSLARSALHRAIDTLEIAGRDNRDAVHARARQLRSTTPTPTTPNTPSSSTGACA